MVVNQDAGATAHGQKVDVGASLVSALGQSADVTSRLKLHNATLRQAQAAMDRGGAYATLVIPSTLSRSALLATGTGNPRAGAPAKASVELLENSRLGSLGVNLAAGVMTPAITKISPQIGTKLKPLATPAAASDPVTAAQLADPIALTTATYRPLPDHSALGLSAFYIALLAIMSGFVAATLINASIDSALGYGATELWTALAPSPSGGDQSPADAAGQVVHRPGRRAGADGRAAARLRRTAAHVRAPHSAPVAAGRVRVADDRDRHPRPAGHARHDRAAAGDDPARFTSRSPPRAGRSPSRRSPASSTWSATSSRLRQVLTGTRAIMYFGARGDAGLTHALILIAGELCSGRASGSPPPAGMTTSACTGSRRTCSRRSPAPSTGRCRSEPLRPTARDTIDA